MNGGNGPHSYAQNSLYKRNGAVREKEMEDERTIISAESYAMNGGDGPHSYAQNSLYQRGILEAAKDIIKEEVATKFNIKQLSSASVNPIRVADFGCSTGPNTFLAMQTILEAIELKFQSQGLNSRVPEFQVFFNDHVYNDFNRLFASLPPERRYYAAAVPGSFHNLLFPKASLNFVYSSCAINWLSKVPKEIIDKTSPAWNKGRIHYTNAPKEVLEAYSAQFAKDLESFWYARSQELEAGGLMALLIPCDPDVILNSRTTTGSEFDLLGSCLMDMAKMRLVSEEKVDSFNLPVYYPSLKELEAEIQKNEYFSIERMETLNLKKHVFMPNIKMRTLYLRAVFEGVIGKHFGSEIMDELFKLYTKKVADSPFFLNPDNEKAIVLFVLLKCKANG